MELEVKEINNKDAWENFLKECQEKTFLQSWNWGEFQKARGEKIMRLGVFSQDRILGVVLVVKISAKRGTFLFLPHGPVIKYQTKNSEKEILEALLGELKKIAKKERAAFIRVSPICERNEENMSIFKNLGFRNAPIHMHAELTWELDLKPNEEEILKGMRKTTRYLIKQAEKNSEIKIIKSREPADLETFRDIYQETVLRHRFVPFSKDYLEKEFQAFKSSDEIIIFLGKYKEKVVSSAIIVFWQNCAFYHHGASLSEYNKIPVSYLLQWEVIKEAKSRGCQFYNFWGIAHDTGKNHPWAGLTLFKQGFGGYKKEYVKTQDYALSFGYWPTYLFEKLRRLKRQL